MSFTGIRIQSFNVWFKKINNRALHMVAVPTVRAAVKPSCPTEPRGSSNSKLFTWVFNAVSSEESVLSCKQKFDVRTVQAFQPVDES